MSRANSIVLLVREQIQKDIQGFYTGLLGPPSKSGRNKRTCYNSSQHARGDKTPSLTFSPTHGGYMCHACGEKGDMIDLYGKVKNMSRASAIRELAERHNLIQKVWKGKPDKFKPINEENANSVTIYHKALLENSSIADFVRTLLYEKYGVGRQSIVTYSLGWSPARKRLSIPVLAGSKRDDRTAYNVRFHDIVPYHAEWYKGDDKAVVCPVKESDLVYKRWNGWSPKYTNGGSKVLSIEGHGRHKYLYPYNVAVSSDKLFLVGGELKALMLNEKGVPACTFTCGEGQYDEDLINIFCGKVVYLLMDADDAGRKAAQKLTDALTDVGADVFVGEWTDNATAMFNAAGFQNGDVTDLMRICKWDPSCLYDDKYLKWRHEVTKPIDSITKYEEVREKIEFVKERCLEVPFQELPDPRLFKKWLRSSVTVESVGDNVTTLPKLIRGTCETGRSSPQQKCATCSLAQTGGKNDWELTPAAIMDLVGLPKKQANDQLMACLGITKNCQEPMLEYDYVAVESVRVGTPPLDAAELEEQRSISNAVLQCYWLRETADPIEDGEVYDIYTLPSSGEKNRRMYLVPEYEKRNSGILNFVRSREDTERLDNVLKDIGGGGGIVATIRDYHSRVYYQEQMHLGMLLVMFSPFEFYVGGELCNRKCPAGLFISDTNMGKSTIAQAIIALYGVGRVVDAGAKATHAGLIGGIAKDSSGEPHFVWGAVPRSHKKCIAVDEFNKLQADEIGTLTNMLSSGIAQRVTVGSTRERESWVRCLFLANPRGNKKVIDYRKSKSRIADDIMTAGPNVSRLDFFLVQERHDADRFGSDFPTPLVSNAYTDGVARYHLNWAWTRTKGDFCFSDASYLKAEAIKISRRYGGTREIILPEFARFKVGRIAAAFAMLNFSHDDDMRVVITNDHVDAAIAFLTEIYDKIFSYKAGSDRTDTGGIDIEDDIIAVLDSIPDISGLKQIVYADGALTSHDIRDAVGPLRYDDFMYQLRVNGYMSRTYKDQYKIDADFRQSLEKYIIRRIARRGR